MAGRGNTVWIEMSGAVWRDRVSSSHNKQALTSGNSSVAADELQIRFRRFRCAFAKRRWLDFRVGIAGSVYFTVPCSG